MLESDRQWESISTQTLLYDMKAAWDSITVEYTCYVQSANTT